MQTNDKIAKMDIFHSKKCVCSYVVLHILFIEIFHI